MQTIIDNTQRVFMLTNGWVTIFCNLQDIDKALTAFITEQSDVTLYHFWNGKQTKMYRKELRAMLEAAKLPSEFVNKLTGIR